MVFKRLFICTTSYTRYSQSPLDLNDMIISLTLKENPTKYSSFAESLKHKKMKNETMIGKKSSYYFPTFVFPRLETNDFLKLKKSINGYVTFTSFLSTSTDKSVSIGFAQLAKNDPNMVGVLFMITIDPKISRTYLASISDISYFKSEDEVLFSNNTVFRIRSVEEQKDGLQHVELQLTGEDDQMMVALIDTMMNEVRGMKMLDRLGFVLYKMGALKEADGVFTRSLEDIAKKKEKDIARFIFILETLGNIHADGQDSDQALDYYKLALTYSLEFGSQISSFTSSCYGKITGDSYIAILQGNIGPVLHDQGDLKGAE